MTTVLYIEDIRANRHLIEKYITMMDYEYIEATDGYTGMAAAIRTQPDVAIIDLDLPDINGQEVAHFIRQTNGLQHIPLIALSADTTPIIKGQNLDSDFDVCLNKPIDGSYLLSIIQQLLDTRLEALP